MKIMIAIAAVLVIGGLWVYGPFFVGLLLVGAIGFGSGYLYRLMTERNRK